jgi:UDP-2-acetamido-2-deoxy-ribo-hexuluronate aminotransferase
MKFINLDRQYNRIKIEVDSAIQNVISRSDFIKGEEVKILERQLEGYLQVKNVICCSSGTDALFAALLALDIKNGDIF